MAIEAEAEPAPQTSVTTVDPAPQDAVSRVAFSPNSATLLVSTWAGTLTLHNASTATLYAEAKPHTSALLDAVWAPSSHALYAAALDGSVLHATLSDASVTSWTPLGKHTAAARALVVLPQHPDLILSAGWDSRLRLWDMRNSCSAATADAGAKVYGMAACGSHCAVMITANRKVRVLDLRNMNTFLHDRAPPTLAYQLRGVSASPDGSSYAVGGTEGRVAVDWLDGSTRDPFSFRCHRLDGLAFPVNCISHNMRFGSFATGGGDGHVSFWDGEARKRIAQFARYPTSIASIDFNVDSTRLAVAVSYTFEEGEKDHPPDEVHIRTIEDSYIATKKSKEGDNHNSRLEL